MSLLRQLIENITDKTTAYYKATCPKLFNVCYDPIGRHRKTRAFIGFLFGFTLAVLFYATVIIDLEFTPHTSLALGATIIGMISIGCASSIQVRCVCLLTIPAFLGRAGRSVLKALVLGYVIAGPIFNLTYNGKEIVRTFACTTELTYNLSKTRFDLMYKPFQQVMYGIKKSTNEIKDTVASVNDLISPIVKEMEGDDEMKVVNEKNDYIDTNKSKRQKKSESEKNEKDAESPEVYYENKYRDKIEARCNDQLAKGSERCRDMFSEAYDNCYNKVTWFAAWLLCWPMKLTFICNIVGALGGSNICNPEGKIDAGIGYGYVSLKDARKKVEDSMKSAKMQYQVKTIPIPIDFHGPSDAAKAVIHEFDDRRQFFDSIMMLVKRCLTFIFLKIILSAQKYHDRYLTEIEHDNHYITAYFRKIDIRRKNRGSTTILPLKKIEKSNLFDPYKLKPSSIQRKSFIGQSIKLILEIITTTTFVIIDRLLYEALDLVKRHGRLDFMQTGRHDINLDIRGTGFIATMIKNLISNFNVKKRVKMVASNVACLPRPTKVTQHILYKIYGTYLAIWLMIFVSSYTQRFQRIICSFFYVKREKRRILYLYNETLRRRLGLMRFMRGKVRTLVREQRLQRDMDKWIALTIDLPRCCGWLKYFACARRKCLICGETEPRKHSDYHYCTTPGCFYVHCRECWRDVGNLCLACTDFSDSETENDYDTENAV